MTETLGIKKKLSSVMGAIPLPTLIIAVFWVVVLLLAYIRDLSVPQLISDTIRRFGMNGVLVLAMVPAIQSGTGPNFALPIGVLCGLLAMVIAIEVGAVGVSWLLLSVVITVIFAMVVGYFYGRLLNAVKGSEMTIATYTGFSAVAALCLVWLMVPFKNPKMGWFMGEGLRETIQLDVVGADGILNKFWMFQVGDIIIPTGLLLVFAFVCLLVWIFFRTKAGISISAGGINPIFAQASGIDHDKNRILANVISTILGGIGIIIYSQSYGYAQLYSAPLNMAFQAVAAVLIGGATARRAKVVHVVFGTLLFQGLLTTSLPVANNIFAGTDLSEIMRMVVQNGIILYALTQVKGGVK